MRVVELEVKNVDMFTQTMINKRVAKALVTPYAISFNYPYCPAVALTRQCHNACARVCGAYLSRWGWCSFLYDPFCAAVLRYRVFVFKP